MRTKNTENKRQGGKNTRNNTVIDIKSNKEIENIHTGPKNRDSQQGENAEVFCQNTAQG